MTRLDHNRAKTQLAQRLGVSVNDITKMTIWGNHSTTQYPDLFHCEVNGKNAYEAVGDHDWYDSTYIPTVAKRGAAIIEARGASSAASAASAAVDHIRDWTLGTPDGDWVSMSIPSDGSLRSAGGHHLVVPVRVQGRQLRDRPGPRDRRLQPRQDRRNRGRARQRARRRRRTRPHLTRVSRLTGTWRFGAYVERPTDLDGRRMRRWIPLLMVSIVGVAGFAGCGSDDESASTGPSQPESPCRRGNPRRLRRRDRPVRIGQRDRALAHRRVPGVHLRLLTRSGLNLGACRRHRFLAAVLFSAPCPSATHTSALRFRPISPASVVLRSRRVSPSMV